MDRAQDSEASGATAAGAGATAPWARGGVMSRDWVTPERDPVNGALGGGRSAFRRRRTAFGWGATGAVAVVGVVGLLVWPSATGEFVDTSSTAVTSDSHEPSGADVSDATGTIGTAQMTSVGEIAWTRIDGDSASMPARLIGGDDHRLFGEDDAGGWWQSFDGRTWLAPSERAGVVRRVGGIEWRLDQAGDRRVLSLVSGDGVVPAMIEAVDVVAGHGFTVGADPDAAAADGFPVVLGGDLFLFTTVRSELPWAAITGVADGEPYRVKVAVGDREIGVASGDFHEMPVSRFTLHEEGRAFDVIDAAGRSVWSYSVGPDRAETVSLDVVSGAPMAVWSRWNGNQFVTVDAPWSASDRVDVTATTVGVIARVMTRVDRRSTIWRSSDGVEWEPVDLPAEPAEQTPLNIRQGDDEVIVTAFTDEGRAVWTTRDGSNFDELTLVSGVEQRTRAAFGWVAPSSRSAPYIHVSPDGIAWEQIDLRDLLNLDDSMWDITISARAVGSEIVLLVDRPTTRSTLIGTVRTDP